MNTDSVTGSCEGTLLRQKQDSYCDSSLVIKSGKSGRRDLNPRPLEPHSSALPSCATARWSDYCLPLLRRRQTFLSDAMKTIILKRVCVYSVAVAILLCATGTTLAQSRSRLKLNEDAFAFGVQLIKQGHFIADRKGVWGIIGLRPNSRTSSFGSMASASTQSGIWQSTSVMPRTPNEDTNFPMATSKTSIAAACSLSRVERLSTVIPK